MPIITRRNRTSSFEVIFARFLPFPSGKVFFLGSVPFDGFLPSICVCAFGAREDDRARCPRSLILNTVQLLSGLDSFFSGSEVASSDRLINMLSCRSLQSLIASQCLFSINLLVVHSQYSLKLNSLAYSHLVQTFKDILQRYFTCWQQSLVPSCIEIMSVI